jgi:hypothetical protein
MWPVPAAQTDAPSPFRPGNLIPEVHRPADCRAKMGFANESSTGSVMKLEIRRRFADEDEE